MDDGNELGFLIAQSGDVDDGLKYEEIKIHRPAQIEHSVTRFLRGCTVQEDPQSGIGGCQVDEKYVDKLENKLKRLKVNISW